jgi:hypothetical protein
MPNSVYLYSLHYICVRGGTSLLYVYSVQYTHSKWLYIKQPPIKLIRTKKTRPLLVQCTYASVYVCLYKIKVFRIPRILDYM